MAEESGVSTPPSTKSYDSGPTKGKCTTCNKAGSFRIANDTIFYCSIHRPKEAMDQSKYYCTLIIEGQRCTSTALYGDEVDRQPIYCRDHKAESMINLNEKPCEGCKKVSPKWDFDDHEGRPRYCKSCMLVVAAGEKSDRTYRDKKSTVCKYTSCKSRATFGDAKGYATWCGQHKPADSVDVVHGRKVPAEKPEKTDPTLVVKMVKTVKTVKSPGVCGEPACCLPATYGPAFLESVFCEKHHRVNDINSDEPLICSVPACYMTAIMAAVDDYRPSMCVIHADSRQHTKNMLVEAGLSMTDPKPAKMAARNKEKEVMDMIKKLGGLNIISMDRRVKNGVTTYRPDCLIKCGNYHVVVEVDEHQHRGYEDTKRMIELRTDIKTDVLFLRYNPDKYIPAVSGGVCAEKKERLEVLANLLTYYNTSVANLDRPLLAIYLFYNYWDGQPSTEIIGAEELGEVTAL